MTISKKAMAFKKAPPQYIVNPMAAKKQCWFPDTHQLIGGYTNPNYLNSLWLGIIYPMVLLPLRLLNCINALLQLRFAVFFAILLSFTIGTIKMVWSGIQGKLMAVDIEFDIAVRSIILKPEQAQTAIAKGYNNLVMDAEKLFKSVYG